MTTRMNIHPDDYAAEIATEADVNRERFAATIADADIWSPLDDATPEEIKEWEMDNLTFDKLEPLTKPESIENKVAPSRPGSGIRQNPEDTHLPVYSCRVCSLEMWGYDGIDDGGPGWICPSCYVIRQN